MNAVITVFNDIPIIVYEYTDGFIGLYLVTITGVLISCLVLTVSRSFCEYQACVFSGS